MLVLSRCVGENFVIMEGERTLATIEVTAIDRNRCRIGITAPKEIAVYRREVLERIKEAGK